MAKPWADAGYLCYCVDIQHAPGERREGNIIYVGASVYDWLPPRGPLAFAAFFTPCTHTAVSGARWFVGKGLTLLSEAISLFGWSARIAEWCECPYFIENPVSTLATYWRKPDYTFDPCEFAGYLPAEEQINEAYTKKTCLWTGGGFEMPEKLPVVPLLGSKMHKLPPGEDRANLRSATPKGFAKAVFLANVKSDLKAV